MSKARGLQAVLLGLGSSTAALLCLSGCRPSGSSSGGKDDGTDAPGDGLSTTSTSATVEIVSAEASVAAGEVTTVTVNIRNVPIYALGLFTSDTEHFALVVTSADGSQVTMQNAFGSSTAELRLSWDSLTTGAHATENPTSVCENNLGGLAVDVGQCTEVCCFEADALLLRPRGACPSVYPIDACIAPELAAPKAGCCLELRADVSCCLPMRVWMGESDCAAAGGEPADDDNCPGVASIDNADPEVVQAATLICPEGGPHGLLSLNDQNRCVCCRSPGGTSELTLDVFCDGDGERRAIPACLAGGCDPDYDDGSGSCRMSCCRMTDGGHEVMDLKDCEDGGGVDIGFQSETCELTAVCCQQGADYGFVTTPQYSRATATVQITGDLPGTVVFGLKQVAVETALIPPVPFVEEFVGSSSATVSVAVDSDDPGTDGGGGACPDVAGVWTLVVRNIHSTCGPGEEGWSSTVTVVQSGCGAGALETTGIKDTSHVVSGSVVGTAVTIGPGDFLELGGTTTSTFTMTLTSDTVMEGSESWTWAWIGSDDPSCTGGTADAAMTKNP